jgi:hypothetical protein
MTTRQFLPQKQPRPRTCAWRRLARPTFLYAACLLLLWAIPVGVLSAINPAWGTAMADGMGRYFSALPDSLYALLGTAYLGYTAAREWGKSRGNEA